MWRWTCTSPDAYNNEAGFILNKGFKIVNKEGTENPDLTELFELLGSRNGCAFRSNPCTTAIRSSNWAISSMWKESRLSHPVRLIPRTHVIPEYGVIVKNENETWQNGFDYRNSELADWCTEAGGSHDLGYLLEVCPTDHTKEKCVPFGTCLAKSSVCRLRVATTTSRDTREQDKLERMMKNMGASAYAVLLKVRMWKSRKVPRAMPSTCTTNVLSVPIANFPKGVVCNDDHGQWSELVTISGAPGYVGQPYI